jgi:hypothetical protein
MRGERAGAQQTDAAELGQRAPRRVMGQNDELDELQQKVGEQQQQTEGQRSQALSGPGVGRHGRFSFRWEDGHGERPAIAGMTGFAADQRRVGVSGW